MLPLQKSIYCKITALKSVYFWAQIKVSLQFYKEQHQAVSGNSLPEQNPAIHFDYYKQVC